MNSTATVPAGTVATGGPAGARALRAGRVAVMAVVGVLLAGFAIGIVVWAVHADELLNLWTAPDGWSSLQVRAVLANWGMPVAWYVGYFLTLEVFLVAVSVVAAWFVLRGTLSWFRLYLVSVLILFATAGGGVPLVVAAVHPSVGAPVELLQGVAWIALLPLAYLFPDGRFVPGWSRWLAAGWVAWLAVVVATGSTGEGPVAGVVLLTLFCSCVVASVYRYVRVSGPVERVQTRWIVYAVALRVGYTVLLVTTPIGGVQDETTPRGLATYAGSMLVSYLIAAALPAAIATAIVRYRLFDINVVISRTLVYTVLTAFVVGTYAVVVGGAGALWHGGGDIALPLVATGLVATVFSPIREQVQRRVNRLVYGERHDPYGVLARLGRQLATLVQPEAVAPAIVDAVSRALKAPYVEISLGSSGDVVASAGTKTPGSETFPLHHRGERLGVLTVGYHTHAGRPSTPDRRLLTDLAHQCGAALYAAQESGRVRRLAVDLQHTREQLVSAREEERRHIRRELHDSLGPALGGHMLAIDTARTLLTTDPAAADELLRDLKAHSQEALAEVRRLARRLRPPALDDVGLTAALRHTCEQYQRHGPQVTVEIPDLPALPAAVEVAVYRIAHEALTNVVRHAGARTCRLTVSLADRVLQVDVTDDGRGIARDDPAGVGTASMRERAEELGGSLRIEAVSGDGTRVTARIPLRDDTTGTGLNT
ncbi:GAF domain-containing sensor histidine kinase [Actinoplanes sp. NPDC004185]